MTVLEALLLHTVLQGLLRFLLHVSSVLALLAAPAAAEVAVQEATSSQEAASPAPDPGPLRFEPGARVPSVLIPRDERLVYRAYVNVAIVEANVGWVTQTCAVERRQAPLLATQPVAPGGEVAAITLRAEGRYLGYEMESTLSSRLLPEEWPRIVYSSKSKGSEQRRREIQVGTKDGVPTSSYRRDTKNGAPEGTRIWREAVDRQVPEGTLDMLSAVMMTRTLVRDGLEKISFPLIDKDRVWLLELRRGKEQRMDTGKAGVFEVVEVVLEPRPYPGEDIGKDKLEKFEGVFGIQGSIHLWVEKHTGIVVRIQGDLPLSVLTLGIDVVLDAYSGTPAGFAPVTGKPGSASTTAPR
jgi:hypothetical protein